MTYYLVIYAFGHLVTYMGPMPSMPVCEAAIVGFTSVKDVPQDYHPYCDLRGHAPEVNEMESRQ